MSPTQQQQQLQMLLTWPGSWSLHGTGGTHTHAQCREISAHGRLQSTKATPSRSLKTTPIPLTQDHPHTIFQTTPILCGLGLQCVTASP